MPSESSLEIKERSYLIRQHRYSDTSLIVEWLTEEHGRVSTMARGALRKKSALAGKLDLFFFADISYRKNQRSDLHLLKEVSLIATPGNIRKSYRRLNLLAYFVELIRRTTESDTPVPEIFALFHRTISEAAQVDSLNQLTLWFEWQLLDLLGLRPPVGESRLSGPAASILNRWNTDTNYHEASDEFPTSEIATLLGYSWQQELGSIPKLRGQVLSLGPGNP